MWVAFVAFIPVGYLTWLNGTVQNQNNEAIARATERAIRRNQARGTVYPTMSMGMAMETAQAQFTQTAELTPSPTITPTYTPTPTQTAVYTAAPTLTPTSTETSHYSSAEVFPVYWWINFIPPAPGRYQGEKPEKVIEMDARISYYYPPLAYVNPKADINCDKTNGILECEQLKDGSLTRDVVGLAAACPVEIVYGSIIELIGYNQYWKCLDTGGAIVKLSDNLIWLDLLYPYMPIDRNWGSIVRIRIYSPEGDQ